MSSTPDILKKILRHKAAEVTEQASSVSIRELSRRCESAPEPRGFHAALRDRVEAGGTGVIAELKRASPSQGVLREDYDPADVARRYEAAGAACLSVLTDAAFFQGSPEHLRDARQATGLPVLRKDFVIDPYQVYEARSLGADCILLIVAALSDAMLTELSQLAGHLEMDVLVEVHDREELERALAMPAPLVGVNNRDLRSFETRLETTIALRERVPDDRLLVTESGIHSAADVRYMREHGVHAFLVGEAFMKAPDPGAKLEELFG